MIVENSSEEDRLITGKHGADEASLRMPIHVGGMDNRSDSASRPLSDNDILLYSSATPAVRSLVVTHTSAGSRPNTLFNLNMHEWLRLLLAILVTVVTVGFAFSVPFLSGRPVDLGFTIGISPAGRQVVNRVTPNGIAYNLGVRPGDPVLGYWNLGSGDVTSSIALDGGNGRAVEVASRNEVPIPPLQKFSYLFLSVIFIAVGGPV
jgi:hypothetical protein